MNRLPPARLALALLLLAGVALLGWLGGPSSQVDHDLILRLTDIRLAHPQLNAVAIALTWLGSAYVTLGGVGIAALWRFATGDRSAAVWAFLTVGGGRLLAEAIKVLVGRPRPHFTPWQVPVSSLSFPSGHATNSMLGFGALALFLVPLAHRRRACAVAVLLSISIGLTRPFLGVHWPSDVLGGWMLGGAALILAASLKPRVSPIEA